MSTDILNDFFLDPEIVKDHCHDSELRKFLQRPVIKQSAVLVRFPGKKKWRRLIGEWKRSFTLRNESIPKELDILAEFLLSPEPNSAFVERHGVSFDENLPWIDNFRKEVSRIPAHAVITESSPAAEEKNFIRYAECGSHELTYDIKNSFLVRKQADEMANALRKMFLYSSTLMFVDPYFDPCKERFRETLHAFLSMATKGVDRQSPLKEVIYHTTLHTEKGYQRNPLRMAYRDFCRLAQKLLPDSIPSGMQLEIKFWKEKTGTESASARAGVVQEFHNRYILTERFGVQFPAGLDERRNSQTRDSLNLLSTSVHAEVRSWFQPNSVYDEVEGEKSIFVHGTGS